ncbi:hypothetical protein FB45DRAFT_1056097 [Roridomyces roridus]|uniref:Aminoglycoside phosphotransferase domain-containing protein n=1 Tax=Roridomyces roridus TaxID=1738132 RepID=A0AAD7C1X3_9AGAR|nr:hypothetical protein FB45DRAFT_1056097 [Roridomyces roridus]
MIDWPLSILHDRSSSSTTTTPEACTLGYPKLSRASATSLIQNTSSRFWRATTYLLCSSKPQSWRQNLASNALHSTEELITRSFSWKSRGVPIWWAALLAGSIHGNVRGFPPEELEQRFLSEIATIAYVRKNTTIPVPAVLHYDADPNNAVGARYMIMEMLCGSQLSWCWLDLTPQQRREIHAKVISWEIELLNTSFPASGCIVDEDGTLGPLCQSSLHLSNLRSGLGPVTSNRDYLLVHCSSTLARFEHTLNSGESSKLPPRAVTWLTLALSAIERLSPNAGVNEPPRFSLFHDQLELSHIFVSPDDPTELIGVIDWEGSRVAPVWHTRVHCMFLDDVRIEASAGVLQQEEADALVEQRRAMLEPRMARTRMWLERLMFLVDIPIEFIEFRGWDAFKWEDKYLTWYEYVRKNEVFGPGEEEGFGYLASLIRKYKEVGKFQRVGFFKIF